VESLVADIGWNGCWISSVAADEEDSRWRNGRVRARARFDQAPAVADLQVARRLGRCPGRSGSGVGRDSRRCVPSVEPRRRTPLRPSSMATVANSRFGPMAACCSRGTPDLRAIV